MAIKTSYFSGLDFLFCGAMPEYKDWSYRNITDYYTLQYAHSGYMHLAADDDSNLKRYDAPFVWLMHKGRYLRFGNSDYKPWGHYFVAFRGERMENMIEKGLYPIDLEIPVIYVKEPDLFLEKMLYLQSCLGAVPSRTAEAVHALEGMLLMLQQQNEYQVGSDSFYEAGMVKLVEKMRNSPEHDWDFEKESVKINMSYSHFRMLFRKIFEKPPQQFIIDLRMKKAENLLRDSDMGLQQIAERCGISNVYYFSRIFTQHFKISPSKYRTRFR